MPEALVVSLVANGLPAGADVGVDELREREFSPEIDAFSPEFYRALRESVTDRVDLREVTDTGDVESQWDAIATELDEFDEVYFADEATVVGEIAGAIERTLDVDDLREVKEVGPLTAEMIASDLKADG